MFGPYPATRRRPPFHVKGGPRPPAVHLVSWSQSSFSPWGSLWLAWLPEVPRPRALCSHHGGARAALWAGRRFLCWHQVLKPRCPPWNRVSPPEVHFHEPPGDKNRAGAADLACSERGMPALESRQPAASPLKAVSPTFRDLCPGPLPFMVLQNSLALEGFLLPPGEPALSRSLHPLSLSVPLASSVSGGAGSKLSPAFLAWT